MSKVVQGKGKTRELAIQNALAQLGCTEDEVSVVVLQNATKGFLGIGAAPCIVEVTLNQEEDLSFESLKMEPLKEEKRAKAPKAEQEKKTPAPKAEQPAPAPVEKKEPAAVIHTEKAAEAEKFLQDVITKMGTSVHIEITETEEEMRIDLSGDNMGMIIGRRGETLDALQYLTSLVVNKGEDTYRKVTLDTENYRQKREETLVKLATKLAGKGVKYKRSISLEPMNPYERRIIHSALQDYKGVTTYSTGTEPNRKVVIASTGGKFKKNEGENGGERYGESRRYEKRGKKRFHDRDDRGTSSRHEGSAQPTVSNYRPTAAFGEKLAKAAPTPVEEEK